ncbi:MAG: M28 family metallopeptidase [Planctomycetota bacterium]
MAANERQRGRGPGRRAGSALLAALAGSALLAATCSEAEAVIEPELVLEPVRAPSWLGRRAYDHVATLVSYGPRFTGSVGWEKGLDYIATALRERAGLEPVRDRWTDSASGVTFENISATVPGQQRHRLLIACHHDTKKCEGHPDAAHNFPFVGANDSGSGVGLVLALAEALKDWQGEATLQFVFFDGEESLPFDWDEAQALFGSKRFVAAEEAAQAQGGAGGAVRALVLLDMVGAHDLQIDEEEYSTPELTEIVRAAAKACGHQKRFFQDAWPINDDHVPFLKADIPAIDLIDLWDNPQWHTADDTLEHISADSLHLVGEVVMTALPAVQARYVPPRGELTLPGGR